MQAVKHYSERGAGTPPQNFKTERLFRGVLTKAVSSGKVFVLLFQKEAGSRARSPWGGVSFGAFLCACAIKEKRLRLWFNRIRSDGSAFFVNFLNNVSRCSREVLLSCEARLPSVTAKKNYMLNRAAGQRRLSRTKKNWLRLWFNRIRSDVGVSFP